jgi:putative nucleotidyltransferase with HDIG domain
MEGLKIGKQGSYIEKISSGTIDEINLLARGDGVEVMLQSIAKGNLFYIYPSDNENVMEFFYIISGDIECDLDDEKFHLSQKDHFTIRGLKEPVHFKALTDITYLWMITEPTFYHLSESIKGLLELMEQVQKKDGFTYLHTERVAELSIKVAKKLKLDKESLESLFIAATLHDIGKIKIPEHILTKPGRLTDEEYEVIKQHPFYGAEIVKDTHYTKAANIILQHHERLNGSGYPFGLKNEEISLEARIIAVCDSFDAMTEERPYRAPFSTVYAMDELKSMAGTHYDPEVVAAFEKVLREEKLI